MTNGFPDTPDFTGLNAPVRIELEVHDLPVEGEMPAAISGAFFRAIPDPAYPPMLGDDTILSGDGMVGRFLIQDGHVDYSIRYVHTERFLAERKARRSLFGRYRNPFTDDPAVAKTDRTVANTTPVWHGGRLLMTKEDGRPYEVDPHTLQTLGSYDFGGRLRSETMTAHVRIDPVTQEMFFFGYEAAGLCSREIAYCIAEPDGTLSSEQWFEAPYCAMAHDFAITERYAIFPLFPTTANLERLQDGGPHWVHEQEQDSWVGVMPRHGKVEEMRWFRGPAGASAYHVMNAHDADGKIHLDLCLAETNAFPFIRAESGIGRQQWEIGGGLVRWTLDMSEPGEAIASRTVGPPGDLPRVRDADQGRPYRAGWYLTIDPKAGPPLAGGPVGAAFNCLLRVEPDIGRLDALSLAPGMAINEPVHVPPPAGSTGEGWLLAVVDHQHGDDFHSELWCIDAFAIAAGPIAKVALPARQRPQVHGWWVPTAELDDAMTRRKHA